MAITFKSSVVGSKDKANQLIVNRVASRTVQAKYFPVTKNASWLSARLLQSESYPLAAIKFPANRKLFRYQPGDRFKLTISEYGITEMVVMVTTLTVEDDESDIINVSVVEDIYAVSATVFMTTNPSTVVIKKPSYSPGSIDDAIVQELPYAIAGDGSVAIVAVAGREDRLSTGYQVWISYDDGVSYSYVGTGTYAIHGTLAEDYSADTNKIDPTGVKVNFNNDDALNIETINDADFYMLKNLAIVGNEIVCFQTIVPVDGESDQYQLSNIMRGLYDSAPATHSAGDDIYYLGANGVGVIDVDLIVGATYYVKIVPFNAKRAGSLEDAEPIAITVTGRAQTPYYPINLRANGGSFRPTYNESDIVLTWNPRLRGVGAGVGSAGNVIPGEISWEGYFKIEVCNASGTVFRTIDSIDATTWTYTTAMHIEDFGLFLTAIRFNLYNYITDALGISHYCIARSIVVYQE